MIRSASNSISFLLLFLGLREIVGQKLLRDDLQEESYDFVVVGAGVAGCTVASRLSENGKHTVLLLEAGGQPHPELFVPALSLFHLYGSENYVKRYQSVPQRNAALTNNGTISMTVGRVLGGGSGVNSMLWNRGSPHNYDAWANSTGDQSWSYRNMLRYLKRIENYEGDFPTDRHGYEGPITVSRSRYAPGMQTINEAGEYLGYPVNVDPNGDQRISFTPIEFSKRRGRRVSSYTGYILPHLNTRHNLRIMPNVLVKRIIFDGSTAIGVIYDSSQNPQSNPVSQGVFVRARKEVIISAGAFESPALLMRSGVGPSRVLESAGVPQIVDLPVGRNLQDHPTTLLHFVINNRSDVFIPERDLTRANYLLYNRTGDGPFSTRLGDTTQAFLASSVAKSEGYPDWADIQLQFDHTPGRSDVPGFVWTGSAARGPDEEDAPFNQPGKVSVFVAIFMVRPKSRGFLTLNSTNIDADPIIDLNYFDDPRDEDIMLDGIRMTLKVFEETPAFQRQHARYRRSRLKACRDIRFGSDSYWRCFIRQTSSFGLHPSGTCKMGRGANDETAVVDTTLKVIGTHGLRVVDASVMPTVTNANTQVPTYAIAEKASEMILQEWEAEQEFRNRKGISSSSSSSSSSSPSPPPWSVNQGREGRSGGGWTSYEDKLHDIEWSDIIYQ